MRVYNKTAESGVSIHAFRGEGDLCGAWLCTVMRVSIHAFRGEGDVNPTGKQGSIEVSIHAFRGEGDQCRWLYQGFCMVRFNPRLPGGRRLVGGYDNGRLIIVSIHAFRGEGDPGCRGGVAVGRGFNPRLPGGRRHRQVDSVPLPR